jgi:RNA polymerase sigma-70 factor (ECF subfamily)
LDAPFPTTIWSAVRRGGARSLGQEDERAAALAELARRYQGPAEAYLRAALRVSAADAHELFQEFFAWMLAGDFLAKADPERGRFRAFLKVALRRFATDELRKLAAEKRGGGRRLTLGALDAAGLPEPADPTQRGPDALLDDAWRAELVDAAFARTERELAASGRGAQFAVFRDFYLASGPELDYRALAERHGITTTDVSNWLQRAKARFREHLRALVLDTVANPSDLGDELAWVVAQEPTR